MAILIAALAPSMALLYYFYTRDKFEREPRRLLIKAFFLGALIVIPIMIVEMQLNIFDYESESLFAAGYTAFVVAGLVEEGFKFLAAYLFFYKDREFDEMYDGIVYCVFISLGFATVENVGYVLGTGMSTAFIRAVTAVPAHALFGVAMGFYLGIAKFSMPHKRARTMRLAVLVPIVLHGIYDFILFSKTFALLLLFIPYMIYLWRRGLKNVEQLVEASEVQHGFRDADPEDPILEDTVFDEDHGDDELEEEK